MMPTVSVIVPNYNHGKFLRRRIDTILAQTYRDFELILLDDASSDDSRAILHEYSGRSCGAPSGCNRGGSTAQSKLDQQPTHEIRLEFNETNSGTPFKQWNKGVRMAHGQYVWIAESDDYATPRFLDRVVGALEANPQAAFAYCRSWRTTDDDRVDGFSDYNLPDPGRWTADFCVDGRELCRKYFALITPVPNASSVVFRKDRYEQAGGADESLQLCGDWKLWAAMAMRGKVAYVSEPLNYFRYHANTARGATERDGAAAKEFLHVSRWVIERVSLTEAELDDVRRARAGGWVPVVMSFRTPAALRREILESVRELDPHPYRWILRPALGTLQRKIQRHWREARSRLQTS